MDLNKSFYKKQAEWTDFPLSQPSVGDVVRVAAIARWAGAGTKRVLELGAGTGQSAAAAADLGHSVIAVELIPQAVACAKQLAQQPRKGSLTVVQGDFYEVELTGQFDVVCYWDGFGVGSDADQRRLLRRIANWLAPGGCALIDIFPPWFWFRMAGRNETFEFAGRKIARRYGFDPEGCRSIDRWWPADDESQAAIQSTRCYSPADLRLLLEGTGLQITGTEAKAAMPFPSGLWARPTPLDEAWSYLVKLEPTN